MNKLIDISYFIKNTNLQNDKDLYLNKNYSKLKNNNLIFQDNSDIGLMPNIPLPKLSFTPCQQKSDVINYNDNFNNINNLCIKRKLLENSLPKNTRNVDYKIMQNKSYTSNEGKKSINQKIFFPILKANSNKNIIKEISDKNSSLLLNTNNINNNIKDFNTSEENNLEKNEEIIDNYMNILSIKPIKPRIKNIPKIQIKFPEKKKEDKISIYNSKIKLGKMFNVNNILNNNKFTYKNKFLLNEKPKQKVNYIFNISKSVKSLNDKIKIKKPKNGIKIFPHINNEQTPRRIDNNLIKEKINEKEKIKDKNETDIINKKNNLNINAPKNNNIKNNTIEKKINIKSPIKLEKSARKEKPEKIINNSYSHDITIFPKKILNKIPKIINNLKKIEKPKITKLEKVPNFIKSYELIEKINQNYLSKKYCPYLLNNIININTPQEKYYYTVNKMYIRQLPEYMKHRINWELIDTRAINLEEEKNININFQWKYFSDRLNFKKYRYDPNIKTPNKKLCMVNLFERNYEIGNKRNMFKNLISYCDKVNLNVFDFVPFTMIVNYSKDIDFFLQALKEIMNFINNKKYDSKENLITNRKYSDHFWFDKNYNLLENQYININKNFLSDKNYWIIKPPDLYQGKCIEISDNFDEINKTIKNMFKGVDKRLATDPDMYSDDEESNDDNINNNHVNSNIYNYLANSSLLNANKNNSTSNLINNSNNSKSELTLLNNSTELANIKSKKKEKEKKKIYSKITCFNEVIVQKYLDNPLLYKKRKFDIRCFVLVDGNLNVYFCREGHLKGSSEFYDINKTNKFIHITNHSLQKKSAKFEQYEYGNEMSYADFKKFMKEEQIPLDKFNKMIEDMKMLVKISFKSVGKKLLKVTPILCFEIFGYDFILDNDFRPWILEINNNPGLGISSPVIHKLVPRMFDDALRLTIDKVFETKYSEDCIDKDGKYLSKYKLEGFTDDENVFEFMCNVGD